MWPSIGSVGVISFRIALKTTLNGPSYLLGVPLLCEQRGRVELTDPLLTQQWHNFR